MSVGIKGFIPTSMLDWEGMIVSTIFLPRCDFRCPYCQNPDLVLRPDELPDTDMDELDTFLSERKGWIDGICVTGGEPCMHAGLGELLGWFKERDLGVKLDTNGSFPDRLSDLIDKDLIDYVAMDIKARLEVEPYSRSAGVDMEDMLQRVRDSIALLRGSGVAHEFRTTVVPTIMEGDDVVAIARYIEGERVYALQNFAPGDTLDPDFSDLKPFTAEELESMRSAAEPYVESCVVRGAVAGVGEVA